ncbi:PREDICTED: pentatricopeptide repeat-containing protein At3g12770-like [Nelumbo nucifera]|uniref:Pentatricopeptide repeat-containing protein At3g12770-like n=2 Tax=Nelumbo nucifera TaxID=4432 RepID=A0A1U8A5X2_NELNU|nr:PREDICTED: pentatricopeptide repeat-containing protein At3g12770-like [Nelumbo nucifera]XP_010257237.1 PREDICTED: pentatricopeptide repeat-containing protein At3g12770-like [Nelumbo nucifera]XP_019053321.1 PREDICTED: pentatricopeptide repeat-containing protein At3g12770-like [Nelumbo nucifera]XP_019053322.1 PREDICTED: pentatricopeptide repeat-containing protein At3g12770-like [Nelumbo nucifera]DAD42351.1 TPA_asm: hypothetical protein HUJ06_000581 [Nelumbo nucifera]
MVISTSISFPKACLSPTQTQKRDATAWNSIIRQHVRLRNDQGILASHAQMEALGVLPDNVVLPLILKACARLKAVERGRKIYSDIQNTRLIEDVRVRTALIDFYSKCGFLEDARQLFEEAPIRDVVCWNAMISGHVENCCYKDAIWLFARMQKEILKPSSVTLVGVLSACEELSELRLGQEVHCYCLRSGQLGLDPYVGTALIGFYSRFDGRVAAQHVFNSMLVRNIVSWNAMISGYFNMGYSYEALKVLVRMLTGGIRPDSVTMLVSIQSCMDSGSLELGKQIHQLAVKLGFSSDLFITNALIIMYCKKGSFEFSKVLFETLSGRDVALWNAMLSACRECGFHDEAFTLFSRMRAEAVKEDVTTVAIMLSICAESASGLGEGKCLHAYFIKSGMEMGLSLGNALLSMYTDINCVESVQTVFDEMRCRDVVSWNILVLALARNKLIDQVRDAFTQMQQCNVRPNSFTMVSALEACGNETYLTVGRSIHCYVIRHGLEFHSPLCTALTEMYINCGNEAVARHLFENFPDRDLISWNALIASYVQNNWHNKALLVFHQMIFEVEPNPVTIINVLSCCTHLAYLPQGRSIHAYTIRRKFNMTFDMYLGNALVTMYARCGSLKNAEMIFRHLPRKDIISWNAMIAAYGIHGRGKDALLAFSKMQEDGIRPTSVTFVSLLSACSHSGMIDEGWQHFHSMTRNYNITPEVVHYACMVDLLGRGGHLEEAKYFIDSMPIKPDACVWRALLGACRVYSEVKLAGPIFEKLVELEPLNAGNYVLLSNIYAAAGLWEEVRNLRAQIKEKGLSKPQGNSWIVTRNRVHCFSAGDRSHPQSDRICMKLSCLISSVKEIGYVPDRLWVLHDVEDEEKDLKLFSHSEKLAIAFGLLNTTGRSPILITKNLRVCGDCHTFSKLVSKFVRREIILRDATRFHHFTDGVCSCKDYW